MSIRTTLELLHSRYLGAVAATPSLPSTWDVLFRRSFWLVEVAFDWLKSSYFPCHFADSEPVELPRVAIDHVESAMVAAIAETDFSY